jgi:hypothetical protein
MTDFIFFGCWNNIDCHDKNVIYNYRDIVLDYIRDYEKPVPNLFLAGDNWYYNILQESIKTESGVTKLKDFKYYLTTVLQSGYHKIYTLNKNTHIVLGNHDVNTDDTMNEKKKNCMLNTQKYFLEKLNQQLLVENAPSLDLLNTHNHTLNKDKITLYEKVVGKTFNDKFHVIFLNTNVFFDFTDQTQIKSTIENIRIELNKVRNKQQEIPIFVMGHHPILCLEIKKDKKKLSYICEKCDDYFDTLYDLLIQFNCIYLCADTHNFQILELTKHKIFHQRSQSNRLLQPLHMLKTSSVKSVPLSPLVTKVVPEEPSLIEIVSGTGGGEPRHICDTIRKQQTRTIEQTIKNRSYQYKMMGYGHNSFGYTKISIINNHTIEIKYIKVIDSLKPEIDYNAKIFNNYKEYTYNLNKKPNGYWNFTRSSSKSSQSHKSVESRPQLDMDRINLSLYRTEDKCRELVPQDYLKYVVQSDDKTVFCFKK